MPSSTTSSSTSRKESMSTNTFQQQMILLLQTLAQWVPEWIQIASSQDMSTSKSIKTLTFTSLNTRTWIKTGIVMIQDSIPYQAIRDKISNHHRYHHNLPLDGYSASKKDTTEDEGTKQEKNEKDH